MKIYFLHRNAEFLGPYSLDDLRNLPITSSDLIWKDGTEDWVPAEKLEEFACMFTPVSIPTLAENNYSKRSGGLSLGRFLGWRR
jgi:hypothetical protein